MDPVVYAALAAALCGLVLYGLIAIMLTIVIIQEMLHDGLTADRLTHLQRTKLILGVMFWPLLLLWENRPSWARKCK
jgi:hypothetical protein